MSNKKWKMSQIFVAFSDYLNFNALYFLKGEQITKIARPSTTCKYKYFDLHFWVALILLKCARLIFCLKCCHNSHSLDYCFFTMITPTFYIFKFQPTQPTYFAKKNLFAFWRLGLPLKDENLFLPSEKIRPIK